MDELERLEKRIDEIENDLKEFKNKFHELKENYMVSASKIDNIYEMLKEIRDKMKKPIDILINICTSLVLSGITGLITYFIVRGGK